MDRKRGRRHQEVKELGTLLAFQHDQNLGYSERIVENDVAGDTKELMCSHKYWVYLVASQYKQEPYDQICSLEKWLYTHPYRMD